MAVLALAAVFVLALALRNPQPPLMPRDDDHAGFVSAGTCLACHGPGGGVPQSSKHPLGQECLRCHGSR